MKWLFAIIIAAVLLFGVALPAYLAPDDLAHCTAPATSGNCATADAIVAISGGDTLARAREAVKLYKDGYAPTVIFSGAASDKTGPSNASVMSKDAQSLGVPESAIIMDEDANTTGENAVNVAKIASDHHFIRLILVTSGYHQRRASLEFNKAVGTSATIVNHPVHSDNQWSNWWWATPIGWWLSISELVKIGAFYVGFSG